VSTHHLQSSQQPVILQNSLGTSTLLFVVICLAVLIKHPLVTVRQTDRKSQVTR